MNEVIEKVEVKINHCNSREDIEALGSALTWEGLAIDDDCLKDVFEWLENLTPVKTKQIFVTSGKLMNESYHLKGNNKYPDDLHIVSIKLEDMVKPQAVVIPRFQVGGRWMDDIISNNISRN